MDSDKIGITYLLHFDSPLGRSRHYLGWTSDLDRRLESHRNGARHRCVLTYEARIRGITWQLARTWENVTIHHEKKLKAQKNNPRLCPKPSRCREATALSAFTPWSGLGNACV